MPFPQEPPQPDDDHSHDPPQDPPSPLSAYFQDRGGAFDHQPFEVEPPYLPGTQNHSFGTTKFSLFPRTYTNRRPTSTEANDGIFHDNKSGVLDPDWSFELQDVGHQEPSHSKQHVLYQNALPGEITPYLGLRARLTQVPINRWTVLLLLVLARMLILFGSLNTNMGDAKSDALSACDKVEDIGNALVSVPHYFANGLNEIIGNGVTDVVRGLVNLLTLILTGFQETIFFVIEYYLGTITCLVDAFVHGALDFSEYAINQTVGVINTAVQDTLKGLEDAVNDVGSTLDTISKDFGYLGIHVPSLSGIESDLSGLSSVTNINASGIVGDIETLNNEIPSFDDLKNITEQVIAVPFDLIRNLLNESYGNWTFDTTLLEVPAGKPLTFCSDNSFIEDFFQSLTEIAAKAKIVAIVALVLLSLGAMAAMAWWEIKRYRRTVEKTQRFVDREPMDVSYMASRPLTASTGLWFSEKLTRDPRRQMLIRWVIAYATTYTALFVLSLALAGGLSSLCQFLVMRAVQKEAPALATEVGTYVGDVVAELEQASTQWANASNTKILALQDDINDDVLSYVLKATSAVNATLFTLNDQVNATLVDVFGNTQLEAFFYNIYGCILGSKITEVDEGINWLHNHAQVSFPLFPADMFTLGGNDSATVSHLLTNSTTTTTTADEITAAADKVVDALWTNLVQESLIALVLLLVYVAYVLFGVAQTALRMCCRGKYGAVLGDKTFGRLGM